MSFAFTEDQQLLGDSAARSLDLAKTQLLRAGDIIRRMRDLISTGSRTFAEERRSGTIELLMTLPVHVAEEVRLDA